MDYTISTDEAPHSQWAKQLITDSLEWSSIGLTQHSFESILCSCSPSTPFVFVLEPGTYTLSSTLRIQRSAPCILRSQETHSVTIAWSTDSEQVDVENDDGMSLIAIEGLGDVVIQGIKFDASSVLVEDRRRRHCITLRTHANLCLTDCILRTSNNDPNTLGSCGSDDTDASESYCLLVQSVKTLYASQSDFIAGDAAICCDIHERDSQTMQGGAFVAQAQSSSTTIVFEDCGFLSCDAALRKPSSYALRRGIYCKSNMTFHSTPKGTLHPVVHQSTPCYVVADHMTISNLTESFLQTSSRTGNNFVVSVQHSTISGCAGSSHPSVLIRGGATVHMVDCSIEHCGTVVAAEEATLSIRDSLVKSILPKCCTFRQLLVQDRSSATIQRCEWSSEASAEQGEVPQNKEGDDAEPSPQNQQLMATMVLLSSGKISVESNTFQHVFTTSVATVNQGGFRCSVLTDGSSAPHISANTFQGTSLALTIQPKQEEVLTEGTASINASCKGILLGLWHDAKFRDNQFTGVIATEDSYCGLEEFPVAVPLSYPWGEDHPLLLQPMVHTKLSGSSHEDTSAVTTPIVARPPSRTQLSAEAPASAMKPQPPPPAADVLTDDIPEDNEDLDDKEQDKLVIARLEQEVKILRQQLLYQQNQITMTDSQNQPKVPSAPNSRPNSARPTRPTSAKSDKQRTPTPTSKLTPASVNLARPLSGGSRARTSTPNSPRQSTSANSALKRQKGNHDPVIRPNNYVDDRVVKIGAHKWNMALMKFFLQGKLSLSEVRVPVEEEDDDKGRPGSARSQKASNSPTRIYDDWKSAQARRLEKERILTQQMDTMSKPRKLTPRQQQDLVRRIHTESVQHHKETHERQIEEELGKFGSAKRTDSPLTKKEAAVILEKINDFEARMSKDLSDRKDRREKLLRKYVPEQPATKRNNQDIHAYCNSLYRSHQDQELVKKASDVVGVALCVVPAKTWTPPSRPRKILSDEDLIAYCSSLYTSHRDEHLAVKAAAIAGDDRVARAGSRSHSNR